MTPLLKVKKLSTTLTTRTKKIRAVRNVSFELYPGEMLGIVGESGCGKSMLAKSLMSLLPKSNATIEHGEIFYSGANLLELSEKEMQRVRGREMSMIFQDPMTSLNPTMKIGKQIVEGYRRHFPKTPPDTAYHKAIDLLEHIGISSPRICFELYPHELSGGMRQRVMIAIALISSANILIADEPTTSLDVSIQAQILELLKELQHTRKLSIIFITHDLSLIAAYCDRALVMYGGQIVESAPVERLFAHPKHPYTKQLLAALPRLDRDHNDPLMPIDGKPPDLSVPTIGCSFAPRCADATETCRTTPPDLSQKDPDHKAGCHL